MNLTNMKIFLTLEVPFQTTVFNNVLNLVGWLVIENNQDFIESELKVEVQKKLILHQNSNFKDERYESLVLKENSNLNLTELKLTLKNDSYKIDDQTKGMLFKIEATIENNKTSPVTEVLRLVALYNNNSIFSENGTVTFDNIPLTPLGGPMQLLPKKFRDSRIILDFWAINSNSNIIDFKLDLEIEEAFKESLNRSSVYYGLSSDILSNKWPDLPNSLNLGGQVIFESKKGINDISISVSSIEKNDNFSIFIGNTSHLPAFEEISEVLEYGILEDYLKIEGILISEIPEEPEIFIVTSREIRHLDLDTEISWFEEDLDRYEFGAIPWKKSNRFRIKFPIRSLHNYPGSIGLRYRIGSKKGDFGSYIEKCLTSLVNTYLENQIDQDQGILKKSFRKISKTGFIPNKSISLIESKEVVEENNLIFGFHNFSDTEGAPLVFKNVVENLSEKFSKKFTSNVIGLRDGPLRSKIKDHGINCLDLFEGSIIGLDSNSYVLAFNKVLDIFKLLKPKLLFTNSIDSFILIDVAWRLKIPSIMLIHESINPEIHYYQNEIWLRQRFLRALDKVNKLIFVSDKTRKLYRSLVNIERTKVIRNGINKNNFLSRFDKASVNEIKSKYDISADELVFLSVGTTTARKGQDRTVRELAEIKKIKPNLKWKFLIVGGRDIPFKDHLVELISKLQLQNNVFIVPETSEVYSYYKLADAFILNSKEESSPLVILEAFCAKVPVFSTNVFGLSEILEDQKNSIIFDGEKPGELAKKLICYFDNPAPNLLENAYTQVDLQFSEETTIQKYIDLVSEFV